jgi:hypothetical protein
MEDFPLNCAPTKKPADQKADGLKIKRAELAS